MPRDDVCDACFMECERRSNGFPCSSELREWARKHREDTGFYFEELSDVRRRNAGVQLPTVEGHL